LVWIVRGLFFVCKAWQAEGDEALGYFLPITAAVKSVLNPLTNTIKKVG